MKLDLNAYATPGAILLSGRQKGSRIRQEVRLAEAEKDSIVEVVVPENVISINSSFFLGLFGESVRHLGREKFEKVFKFRCRPKVLQDVDDGISQALKESDPLPV